MIRRSFFLVVCLLFALVTLHAQSNYAVVRGSVLDPQHRPVAGARIHLTSTDTGAQREVAANNAGLYEIAGLQPGDIITQIDDVHLDAAHPLALLLRSRFHADQRVTVTYSRGATSTQAQLKLTGQHPTC